MKFTENVPPREFRGGKVWPIPMRDVGRIELSPSELITFTGPDQAEFDISRTTFGYYATPSVNQRLKSFGWRTAVARNPQGHLYVLLVHETLEHEYLDYLEQQEMEELERLDEAVRCPLCGTNSWKSLFVYEQAPSIEHDYDLNCEYQREYRTCNGCGHALMFTDMALQDLYLEAYVDANYAGHDGLLKAFKKITSLPKNKSDNEGRVRKVCDFAERFGQGGRRLLDVGSGLGVFPWRMAQEGWDCHALDTDPRQKEHLEKVARIPTHCVRFEDAHDLGVFDAVTFNRVLEHVQDPVTMLKNARNFVRENGFVYIEVPDILAAQDGPDREEFTIDHWHVYSPASLCNMARNSGFEVVELRRHREPSGKYTLYAFLNRTPD